MKRTRAQKSTPKAASASPPKADVALLADRRLARKVLGGIAERTFASLEAEGVLVASKRGRGGRASVYDIQVIVPAYLAYVSNQRPAPEREARARRDTSQADLLQMKLARERGELLPRDAVIREGQAYTKAWTAKVRSWPRRARQLGIITTPEQEAQLTELSREILSEIARWKTLADAAVQGSPDEGPAA